MGLERVLDLGYQPLCNEFLPADEAPKPQTFYPLCLCFCHKCSLAQLDYVMPTEIAFGNQYTYLTGSSQSLIQYYSDLAKKLTSEFNLKSGDTVIEIGSNDGTFLKAFSDLGINVIGVDGAQQSSNIAVANGIRVIPEFFGRGSADTIKKEIPSESRVALILAMNVLAHTEQVNEFLDELTTLMDPETVMVSSSHWLVSLINNFEFDTIYHEHLRYYSLTSLTRLFESHNLTISHAEITDFYGGSVLTYATVSRGNQSENVQDILSIEADTDIIQSLRNMNKVLLKNRAEFLNLLVGLQNDNKQVAGIGAPMKASTLLNFYGVTSDLVGYLGEVNHLKIGTVVPGVRLPVVHEDVLLEQQPDYALLLSWNMADFLLPKFRERGYKGKFILPVPQVKVIE